MARAFPLRRVRLYWQRIVGMNTETVAARTNHPMARTGKSSGDVLARVMLFLLAVASPLQAGNVRNGSFSEIGFDGPADAIAQLRQAGWTCPDAGRWPKGWTGHGENVTLEWYHAGGKLGDAFCRIGGPGGYLAGRDGIDLGNTNRVLTVWARGHGTLQVGFLAYGVKKDAKTPDGFPATDDVPAPLVVKVASGTWVRYQHLLQKTPKLASVRLTVTALEGGIDFDEVDLEPATPARERMVREAGSLYGAGSLVEDKEFVPAADKFRVRRSEYENTVKALRERAKTVEPALLAAIEEEITALKPFLEGDRKNVLATAFNDMVLLTRVCAKLSNP